MQHKLLVDYKLIERDAQNIAAELSYSLFYQMASVTMDKGALKHDDRLNCLAIAVNYWTRQIDEHAIEYAARTELLDKELDDFIAYAGSYQNLSRN
ncbi:hypothetical protein [Candidatus Enterovibrio escicola]|uniref:hypothetical protein n=2 Tax=Candidatus Enterovibrio escicola TaxID=1927127 RepID=UPI001237AC03|nr:hypothetical protein [Candidatus Enterovibrio escacola]